MVTEQGEEENYTAYICKTLYIKTPPTVLTVMMFCLDVVGRKLDEQHTKKPENHIIHDRVWDDM